MTQRVVLHPLPGGKRAGELARLVDRLHRQGRRVVVWVADDARRQVLDDYLWTYDRLSFLPHVTCTSEGEGLEEAVVLVGEAANPNRADLLVVGDELPPAEWAAGFAEVHDLLPPGEEGERRRAAWRGAGFEVEEVGGS